MADLRTINMVTPSKEDNDLWENLTREEQIQIYKNLLNDPDSIELSEKTVPEILAELKQKYPQN